MRDVLEKGMRVFVKVRHTNDGEVKLKPARVMEVLRGAAKVSFEGDTKGRTIRFSMIEVDQEEMAKREKRKVVGDDTIPTHPPLPPPPAGDPRHGEPPTNEMEAAAIEVRKAVVNDDLQTWITMGREMLDPIKQRCADLEEELRALADEHTLIAQEIQEKKSELDELNGKQRVINGTLREMGQAS